MGTMKDTPEASELRRRAEKKFAIEADSTELLSEMSPEKIASLIHELQVHQIELKMQNEELRSIQDELEKTRNKYSHLYDFAPIGYFTVNPKGIIHEANLTIASMLGADRSALIGQPFARFVLKDDQDTFYKHRQRLLETEAPQSCKLRLVKKDGHPFYARIEYRVITTKGDDGKQIRAAVSDITDQERAEALQESETFLETLIDTIPTPVFYKDRDGKYLGFNKAFETFFGETKEKLMGKSVFDINPPELAEIYYAQDEELFNSGGVQHYESQVKNVQGKLRDVIFNKAVFTDSKGVVTGLIGAIIDITERNLTDDKLRESENRFRDIAHSMADWIWEVDKDGKYTYVSHTAKNALGYSPKELIGKTPFELMPEGERNKIKEIFLEIFSRSRPIVDLENWNLAKDGTEICFLTNGVPIIDADGELQGYRGVDKDITNQKKLEAERITIEAQLQQSQKMEAVGTLAGGIAHDFNNILAIILGNAELASADVPDSNPASASLKEIHRASIRAKDMVQQLLAFSRKTDEVSIPINMALIIKESLKMLKHAIPTSVEFKQHISDDSCNVMGDASQINQIVMNLVTNAADAMSEEGELVEVTLENIILQEEKICFDWVLSPGPYVRLRMRDTGEGIEPKIMDRIFEPYYTTKEIGKGTGMGLSVIHGIVKRHNGGIRVESELGKGTFFEIYFPALEKAAEEEKEPEGEIKGGSERILFVDDEESMVNLNHQRLERLGYNVKSTTKPVEALEWFRADPDQFDVIITDMTMPRMTGDRLAAEILKIRPHMPVIICTGYSERMSAKKAAALGVRKYIEKPIGLRNLASLLREVLEGK